MATGRSEALDQKTIIFTEEEAEIIMQDSRHKEFWDVDNVDNLLVLQEAIDVLYNIIPGNTYRVDYQEYQTGTRLVVCCEICSKELTSYDPFISHHRGKSHNKVRQQKIVRKDPNIRKELQRKPLSTYRGTFPEGSLEDMIDSSRDVILGVQFVYKEMTDLRETFSCQLCHRVSRVERIRKSKMLAHLQSKEHNMRYLEIVFNFKINADYEEESRYFQRREGRIHAPIVDFSKQLRVKQHRRGGSANHVPLGRSARENTDGGSQRPKKDRRLPPMERSQCSNVEVDRCPSPHLFKIEPVQGAVMSCDLQPPARKDVGTSCNMTLSGAITDKILIYTERILHDMEARKQLLEEKEVVRMLFFQTLNAMNTRLKEYFDANDVTIINENGSHAVKGVVAADQLKAHLQQLEIAEAGFNSTLLKIEK